MIPILVCLSDILHLVVTSTVPSACKCGGVYNSMGTYDYCYACPSLSTSSSSQHNIDSSSDSVFESYPGGTAGAATTGAVALAALTPAPLPMFPPSILPQPGVPGQPSILGGGGAIPAAAVTVRKLHFKLGYLTSK